MENKIDLQQAKINFLQGAKKSIKKIEQKQQTQTKKNKKKNHTDELAGLFVKASEITSKTKDTSIHTLRDEFVLKSNGKYVLSASSYDYRYAVFKVKDSLERKKLITGKIESIEEINGYWTAVMFIDTIKVLIPIFELFKININSKADTISSDARAMMSKRLGGTIDFVIHHFDEELGLAVGSRLEAMKIKADLFYRKKIKQKYLINVGDIVKARVVSVAKGGIVIEVMGAEVFLPAVEATNASLSDLSTVFSTSDEVDAKILNIYEDGEGNIEIEASLTAVNNDIVKRIYDQITPEKKYVGKITAINQHGVFVQCQLSNYPFSILCAYPEFGLSPAIGANVTVKLTSKNDKGFYGLIQHISI